mmetsp:Transcript_35089/g.48666  ORF Transcript_35089/g.48666 Transcript_35089/m.48666 type:complete len:180 (-) Transcript_35089:193-732(-)
MPDILPNYSLPNLQNTVMACMQDLNVQRAVMKNPEMQRLLASLEGGKYRLPEIGTVGMLPPLEEMSTEVVGEEGFNLIQVLKRLKCWASSIIQQLLDNCQHLWRKLFVPSREKSSMSDDLIDVSLSLAASGKVNVLLETQNATKDANESCSFYLELVIALAVLGLTIIVFRRGGIRVGK